MLHEHPQPELQVQPGNVHRDSRLFQARSDAKSPYALAPHALDITHALERGRARCFWIHAARDSVAYARLDVVAELVIDPPPRILRNTGAQHRYNCPPWVLHDRAPEQRGVNGTTVMFGSV